MLNRFPRALRALVCSIALAAPVLAVASPARADTLVCHDALNNDGFGALYRWDDLSSPASQELYLDLEACSCGTPGWTGGPAATLGPCSDACSFTDGSNDWGCGLTWPVSNEESEYTWTQTQADACNACIAETCATESAACIADAPASP